MKLRKFWKKLLLASALVFLVVLILFLLWPRRENLVVKRVIDGDTVVVAGETVRLVGIDAPEREKCFAAEATQKAYEILLGRQIILENDPSQGDTDQYGRLLRYIFLIDGTNVGQLLVTQGFVREETFKGVPYKYQSEFKRAQEQAKENKLGMWADGACKK